MNREELGRRLMASFLGEAEDRIDALNEDMLLLERDDPGVRSAAVQRLFRSAHSLKGAARAVGITSVETMCHRMEELLAGVRDGARPLDAALTELCFKTVDAVQDVTGKLHQGGVEDNSVSDPMIALLDAALGSPAADVASGSQAAKAAGEGGNGSRKNGSTNGSTNGKATTDAVASPPAESTPDADEAAAPESEATTPNAEGPATLRVATERLESLLNESGELVLAHRRVDHRIRDLSDLTEQVKRCDGMVRAAMEASQDIARWQQVVRALESVVDDLRRDERSLGRVATRLNRTAQAVRMTSFASACRGLARAARDVASSEGKRVALHVRGGDVELDRFVVERLRDPLLHLVRNAVSHGVESTEERERVGKPLEGVITLTAALRGDQVQVTVEDDGRGIDHDVIRARATQVGVAAPEDDRHVEQLLFEAGFTTAGRTTRFSGRGVGLDVVKAEVEALHGSIDLHATQGHGCRFGLTVPLTLTAIHALLVRCGGRDFALPSATVTGLVRIRPADVRELPTGQALYHGGRLLPLRFLAPLLGVGPAPAFDGDAPLPVAIVGNAGAEIALVVDMLQTETEILVKELGKRLQGLEFVSGATILENGKIALILNAPAMARSLDGRVPAAFRAPEEEPSESEPGKRLLVADDSVTTRMLLMGVLEEAGFDVTAVPDGMAAWERIQRESFDLVVSDVEMPRMDGFGLTERVRSSAPHRNLPVILVTGLEKEEHRLRGLAVGANAYLVKSGFESHSLLEAIEELI